MRLAPVQCAGWGHPVTSGHKNIDYYFSSAVMEPDNAELHYSEKLILIEGLGTYYSKPVLPTPARRTDFALPEGKTLYLCPQSLFKIHPDNDAQLAHILERDPNGVIVLFAGRHPNITNALLARLAQALGALGMEPQGRSIILPSMAHDDYLRVNMLCDVMLDTLHWSGGNTTLDALACGLPVVTLPGEFMRGRQSYGMLKCMGLNELIAKDQDDYVEIAIKIGTDSTWRQQVVQRIIASRHRIFEMETSLRQLESFYHSEFNVQCGGQ
jgi:protein O-GlcNAc transferase